MRMTRGFTLIELVIALAVFGFIAVALAGGVRFGARAWDRQQDRVLQSADVDAVERVLRRLIEEGRPRDGASNRLRVIAPLPAALGQGGIYDAVLRVDDRNQLVLMWRRYVRGDESVPRPEYRTTVLLKDIVTLRVGYYVQSAGGAGGWRTNWHVGTDPMRLIRLSIGAVEGDRRKLPDLVVAVRAGSSEQPRSAEPGAEPAPGSQAGASAQGAAAVVQ